MTRSTRSLVAAAAGLLIAAGIACGPAAAEAPAIAVMPFAYLDTSGEPRDQRAEHAARIAAMAGDLRASLADRGRFRVVAADIAGACAAEDSACVLAAAREAGADLVVTGAIQKASTMESQMWVGIFAADSGERVLYRNLSFRGDTDEAWRRATRFLVRQIETAAPAVAVLPFGFVDTSFEPEDQTAAHARRLAAMSSGLADALAASGEYRVVALAEGDKAHLCPPEDPNCALERARRDGADLVVAGGVQKISTMATRVWLGIFDTRDGKRVYYRDLNFRGDNDESWSRATQFIARQIEEAKPTP